MRQGNMMEIACNRILVSIPGPIHYTSTHNSPIRSMIVRHPVIIDSVALSSDADPPKSKERVLPDAIVVSKSER